MITILLIFLLDKSDSSTPSVSSISFFIIFQSFFLSKMNHENFQFPIFHKLLLTFLLCNIFYINNHEKHLLEHKVILFQYDNYYNFFLFLIAIYSLSLFFLRNLLLMGLVGFEPTTTYFQSKDADQSTPQPLFLILL